MTTQKRSDTDEAVDMELHCLDLWCTALHSALASRRSPGLVAALRCCYPGLYLWTGSTDPLETSPPVLDASLHVSRKKC